jgi:hypothetical protein
MDREAGCDAGREDSAARTGARVAKELGNFLAAALRVAMPIGQRAADNMRTLFTAPVVPVAD